MTDKISETFGMADIDKVREALRLLNPEPDEQDQEELSSDEIHTALQSIEQNKFLENLPEDKFDHEMDDVADDAQKAFNELFDLGLNSEPRFTGELVSAAERFLN